MNTPIHLAAVLLLASSVITGTRYAEPEDAVAKPPSTAPVAALPASDLSGLDHNTAEAIQQARDQLSQHLAAADTTPATLADGYARLAALYQHAAIDSAAAAAWRNAATLQPNDYRWRYYQGWLALNMGDIPQALQAFQQARQRKPDYAPLTLRLGQAWLADNQIGRARAALQSAAEQPGLRAAALYHLAQIALLQRDYPLALRQLKQARQQAPDAVGLHYPLAQALRGVGQRAQAREQLALVPPGKPRPPTANDPLVAKLAQVVHSAQPDFISAMQAVRKRDYPTALRHFAAGLQIAPENYHARSSYARALWLAGETQAAEQQLHQVLAQQPQAALAMFMLALMAQHDGDQRQAMQLYRQTLAMDPAHQGAHYYLANLLFNCGDYLAAGRHYDAAQHGDSELPAARLLAVLARYHANPKDTAALATTLRTLVEQYPQQAELRYALIRLYALSKDAAIHDDIAAVTLANQLLQDHPGPASLQVLALAVAANGQFEVAADIQQQLIERLQWHADSDPLDPLRATLQHYQADNLPTQEIWSLTDPMLQPPPFDAQAAIREYLTPTPI